MDELITPIEYFYGEEIGDMEIKDLDAIFRKAEPEAKATTMKIMKLTLTMQEAVDQVKINPNHNMSSEEAKRFVSSVMDYKAFVNNLNGTLNGIIILLQSVMKQQGLDLISKEK